MHDIDGIFKARKRQSRHRRIRRRLLRWTIGTALFGVLVIGPVLVFFGDRLPEITFGPGGPTGIGEPGDAADDFRPPVFVPAVVDLAGDPLILHLNRDASALPRTKKIPSPVSLAKAGAPASIHVLSDTMLSSSERFMITLPSTQQDFAFFQAQRIAAQQSTGAERPAVADEIAEPRTGDSVKPEAAGEAQPAERSEPDVPATLVPGGSAAGDGVPRTAMTDADTGRPASADANAAGIDPEYELASYAASDVSGENAAGWGETINDGQMDLPEFKRTRIENTTSVADVIPELDRSPDTEDIFVRSLTDRSIETILEENFFDAGDAARAGAAAKDMLGIETVGEGSVVAIRGLRLIGASATYRLVQMSVYTEDTYRGTLALAEDGQFVSGADPWIEDDLFGFSEAEEDTTIDRQYRLLDAIYSTALRNAVPTAVVGETIMHMSRAHDLNAFAEHDDRLILIYSDQARETSSGNVLYAAIVGPNKSLECYIYKTMAGEYACAGDEMEERSVTVRNGMVTPANGVLTSRFGPRKHPILNTVRIHAGVDWAAPTGTPVYAAFDGTVSFAGDGDGYGNLIKIEHAGGRETRYAHLSKFASITKPGATVTAGDIIGYIGTSGLSTGPHLHFELHRGGRAIDPLAMEVVAVADDGSAVGKFVDQIIRIESGGNPRAKNPLSSATGLGQFIDSTWIRMMNTYRPDLARSLSRQELLDLRYDPTLSTEMVRNLAREGAAYIKARGHAVTPGRLYLSHFLGAGGAGDVLAAGAGVPLIDVVGAGVISANPFLRGMTTTDVENWASRKMSGKRRRAVAAVRTEMKTIRTASKGLIAYREAIGEVLEALDTTL